MAKKVEKTTAKNKQYSHREDAQWLTKEICAEYRKKALQIDHSHANDIGGRRTLRIELQEKCDITEIEAINILNGYHHKEYVRQYDHLRAYLDGDLSEPLYNHDPKYIAWLEENEDNDRKLGDFDIADED